MILFFSYPGASLYIKQVSYERIFKYLITAILDTATVGQVVWVRILPASEAFFEMLKKLNFDTYHPLVNAAISLNL